jgi:hypothetical protein
MCSSRTLFCVNRRNQSNLLEIKAGMKGTRKKDFTAEQEHARILYFNGECQNVIAERVGVCRETVNKWINSLGWKEKRAAITVTRPELINRLLGVINKLLDQVTNSDDPTVLANLPDKLAKFAATIEKLDKKASVVDAIEVFMAFSKWLQYRQTMDRELTPEIVKAINRYQDAYISEQIGKRK